MDFLNIVSMIRQNVSHTCYFPFWVINPFFKEVVNVTFSIFECVCHRNTLKCQNNVAKNKHICGQILGSLLSISACLFP